MRTNILIVSVNWLGDLLFMTPAVRAIRRAHPQSRITCLVPRRGFELMQTNPNINKAIPFEESRGLGGFLRWLWLVPSLRKEHYDAVYLFHPSFTRLLAMKLAGIPARIGPAVKMQSAVLLTHPARMPSKGTTHKTAWYLKVLEADNIQPDGASYDLVLDPKDLEAADKILAALGVKPGEKFVAMHPGANWVPKRWPAERFARLADALKEKKNVRAVFVGGEGDLELVKQVRAYTKYPPVIATGKASLRETAALLRRSSALVSNDSGPLHIGAAVGTAVIGLFGPTDPGLSGPPAGTKGAVISGLKLEEISVEQVFAAVSLYL